jgi:hypothetical protein
VTFSYCPTEDLVADFQVHKAATCVVSTGVMPLGGLDLDDEVWLSSEPVLACLQFAAFSRSVPSRITESMPFWLCEWLFVGSQRIEGSSSHSCT